MCKLYNSKNVVLLGKVNELLGSSTFATGVGSSSNHLIPGGLIDNPLRLGFIHRLIIVIGYSSSHSMVTITSCYAVFYFFFWSVETSITYCTCILGSSNRPRLHLHLLHMTEFLMVNDSCSLHPVVVSSGRNALHLALSALAYQLLLSRRCTGRLNRHRFGV